jgi:hypothetical protein
VSVSGITAEGFEVGDEIGRGGFGIVYRARQVDLGRTVALKILHGSAPTGASRARFEHECRVVGALPANPAIVPVFHAGVTAEGTPFLAMAYLPGGTLAQRMPLPADEVARIGAVLAGGLVVAHAGGVVHRDVKPSNVLFDADGQPVLVDFGIASLVGEATTASGSIALSLGYASPETLDGERVGAPADVYALGATLFAALTGAAPFTMPGDGTIAGMAARIATKPVEDLRPRGVPDALCRVIETAMAKDPAKRYASMAEMRSALQAANGAPGIADAVTLAPAPMQVGSGRRAPRRIGWIAAAAAVVLGGGYTAYALSTGAPAPRPVADTSLSAAPREPASGSPLASGGASTSSSPSKAHGRRGSTGSRAAGGGAPAPNVVVVTLPGGGGVVTSTMPVNSPAASHHRTTSTPPPAVRTTPTKTKTTSAAPGSQYPTPTLSGASRCTFSATAGTSPDVAQKCPGWTSDWYPSIHSDYYVCFEEFRVNNRPYHSTNANSTNGSTPSCDGSSWTVTADLATTTTYYYALRLYYLSGSGQYVRGALSAKYDKMTVTFT